MPTTTDKPNQEQKGTDAQRAEMSARITHLTDCPERRLESYEAEGPRQTKEGLAVIQKYEITRCLDCGAQDVQRID